MPKITMIGNTFKNIGQDAIHLKGEWDAHLADNRMSNIGRNGVAAYSQAGFWDELGITDPSAAQANALAELIQELKSAKQSSWSEKILESPLVKSLVPISHAGRIVSYLTEWLSGA